MYSIRMLGLVVGIPGTILFGLMGSGMIADFLGVWVYHVAAVLMPILGLSYAWVVAPAENRRQALGVYLAVGLILAYREACPVDYPETHPRAYQPTYLPFAITVGSALGYFGFLLLFSRSHEDRSAKGA